MCPQAGLQLSGEQKQQLRAARRALLERLSQVAARRRDTLGQLGLHLLQLPRVSCLRHRAGWRWAQLRNPGLERLGSPPLQRLRVDNTAAHDGLFPQPTSSVGVNPVWE